MRVFGPAPTYWGSSGPSPMTWGSSKWGEGSADLISSIEKLVSHNLSLTPTYSFESEKIISISVPVAWTSARQDLVDGRGYNYVFVGGTTNPVSSPVASYTSQSVSTTWTSSTVSSTSWSES